MSEELTEAVETLLNERGLSVKVEFSPRTPEAATLWLSTYDPDPGGTSKARLEGALARVREGFERNEISGWRGELAAGPNRVWIHDDAELDATVETLEINLTAERSD